MSGPGLATPAMEADQPVRVISPELVLVDWGPMTLTVSAWLGGLARPVMAAKAAGEALRCLAVLADFKVYLKKPASRLPRNRPLPRVVERALSAAARISAELTPLAAVAGAVADQVARTAADLGADRVIVNNGGDVALSLSGSQKAVVGLKVPGQETILARLNLSSGHGVGGVASSGWSGRSFSPGVADLVSVWAGSGALADAAATLVAGACRAAGPRVRRVPASDLDPGSDLGETLVTVRVGRLSPAEIDQALGQGLAKAREMVRTGLIQGCLIDIQGRRAVLDPLDVLSLD